MSRTLSTRWLMPEGLTASAGASGTSEVRSDIAALPNLGCYLVLPRNGSRNPGPQVAWATDYSPRPSGLDGRVEDWRASWSRHPDHTTFPAPSTSQRSVRIWRVAQPLLAFAP